MSERRKLFSAEGLRYLTLELFIVFLGVYLAFLFQNYNENRKVRTEQRKSLIGVKQDLEFFRVYFPQTSAAQKSQAREWAQVLAEEKYRDISEWRFIQPQYDYTNIEYALNNDAQVIDYDLSTSLAMVYQELRKLRQVEEDMTYLAMQFEPIPADILDEEVFKVQRLQNYNAFSKFVSRASDRASILARIADRSSGSLELINRQFTNSDRIKIEKQLIRRDMGSEEISAQDSLLYRRMVGQYFPHFSESDIESLFN